MLRSRAIKSISVAVAMAAVAVLAAPQSMAEDSVKIAVVTHGQSADTYWSVVKKGVDDAAAMMGAEVSYQAPQTTDYVVMSRMIDAAVTQKVQGLVVSIADAEALGKSVKAAADAGIPVIVIDSGEDQVEELGLKLFVGTTSYFEQGKRAAKQLLDAGVKKGVCANHETGNLVNESACDGFIEAMNGKGDRVEISLDPTETAARLNAYLASHPDIDGILALGAPSATNVVAALRDKGTLANYKIGNFDVSGDTLASLSDKELLFSFDAQQYLMGFLPVVMLTLNAKYGVLPINNIYTGPNAISPTDVEKIMVLSKKGIR
ncbi:substrate-binding domain-containing protein [Dongia deserti]|uniref:substrate-binding domain-containing protein n=1 Tax=Dongia deserti TaxID=2268030 RepID=UPI000E651A46|nr:substrate-binding domain-containing protein [Dongia deserti]